MVTLLFSPHSALCAHGWPRRLPVWRKKWLDCCRSWLATPGATCRARAQSRDSLTGWLRCLSERRERRGRAKRLWGKDDSTISEGINHNNTIKNIDTLFHRSDSTSCLSLLPWHPPPLSSGISSQLCATFQQRKVPGRCCSPSTPRPCWWTSCHSAGLPSRGKAGWRRPEIPAWRRPAQPSLTSPSQSRSESGSWFTKWNARLKPTN